jgi:hypothetical protein
MIRRIAQRTRRLSEAETNRIEVSLQYFYETKCDDELFDLEWENHPYDTDVSQWFWQLWNEQLEDSWNPHLEDYWSVSAHESYDMVQYQEKEAWSSVSPRLRW